MRDTDRRGFVAIVTSEREPDSIRASITDYRKLLVGITGLPFHTVVPGDFNWRRFPASSLSMERRIMHGSPGPCSREPISRR